MSWVFDGCRCLVVVVCLVWGFFVHIATQMLNILPCLCRRWKPLSLCLEKPSPGHDTATLRPLEPHPSNASFPPASPGTARFLQLLCRTTGTSGTFLCLGIAPNCIQLQEDRGMVQIQAICGVLVHSVPFAFTAENHVQTSTAREPCNDYFQS